jgi:hypothetical protein
MPSIALTTGSTKYWISSPEVQRSEVFCVARIGWRVGNKCALTYSISKQFEVDSFDLSLKRHVSHFDFATKSRPT